MPIQSASPDSRRRHGDSFVFHQKKCYIVNDTRTEIIFKQSGATVGNDCCTCSTKHRKLNFQWEILVFLFGCVFSLCFQTLFQITSTSSCIFGNTIPTDLSIPYVKEFTERMLLAEQQLEVGAKLKGDEVDNLIANQLFPSYISKEVTRENHNEAESQNEGNIVHEESQFTMDETVARNTKSTGEPEDFLRPIIPTTMESLVAGMGRITRSSFTSTYDMGLGIDPSFPTNEDVLVLYGSTNALPANYSTLSNDGTTIPLIASAKDAMENCDVMKIVLTNPKPEVGVYPHKQCIAIMGQWESYHIQKWERKESDQPVNSSDTLTDSNITTELRRSKQLVSELVPSPSHESSKVPSSNLTRYCNEALRNYLNVYEDAQHRLRPLAEAASRGEILLQSNHNDTFLKNSATFKQGPIIVMVANYGQSTYFLNFYCSARARGLDVSRVLLFATDIEMHQLAQKLGVNTFYDEQIFGTIPKEAATDYHDVNYGKIMMSKVYCVHLINSMGYDVLFQDLDLVWYRNPLPFFQQLIASKDFDMYFQYDGSHHPERFRPLAANTGFYYVRHNARTEYFFSIFVRMGETIIVNRSHQAALTLLANEHMNLYGLRVKVLARFANEFLNGFQYHNRKRLTIKAMAKSHRRPYLFHANWLPNHLKQSVLQKTKNWYVKRICTIGNMKRNRAIEKNAECCLPDPLETLRKSSKQSTLNS